MKVQTFNSIKFYSTRASTIVLSTFEYALLSLSLAFSVSDIKLTRHKQIKRYSNYSLPLAISSVNT